MIILVNPPSNSFRKAEEHLGIAYLKSFLWTKGLEVEILDGYLLGIDCEVIIKEIIINKHVKILGISPSLDSLNESIKITNMVKMSRPDIFICWGGHLASFSANDLLKNNLSIDCIIMGEGEITFSEVAERISADSAINGIKGISFRRDGEIVISESRDLIENLDILPFPDRKNTQIAVNSGSVVQISGSRGCYGNCSFCSINSLYKLSNGKSWRGRSAKSIVSELDYLKNEFGFSVFKFVDDSFFGPDKNWKSRAIDIANGIIERKLDIRFRISTRVNNVDRIVFSRLKQAGLYAVSVGVESGVQRALETFNKGTTVEQNKVALKILNDLGIITLMGFIGFDPYTSLEEVEENIEFLKNTLFCMSDIVSKSLYIHAADAITKQLIKEGRIKGRNFPNYVYEIEDKRVGVVLKCLEFWNIFNKELFYKVSDPLTAPRITNKKDEVTLLRLHLKLRKIDIDVFDKIVKMVRAGYNENLIKSKLNTLKNEYVNEWLDIDNQFNQLQNKL